MMDHKLTIVIDGETSQSFSSANHPRETNLKAVLEPYELPRSLQLCLHGPHEEITHSFVIVEDAPSLLKTQAHICNMNAAWCVMFSRVWLTWSLPQRNHRGSVWSQSFPCCGGLIGQTLQRAFPLSITADGTVLLP